MFVKRVIFSCISVGIIISICSCSTEPETPRQIRDKEWIEQSIIDNIEVERLMAKDSIIIAEFDSVSRQVSFSSIYRSHAVRLLKNSYKREAYPKPASEQVDVKVDKIFYSEDSLKCAATIVVHERFDILPEFKDPDENYAYSAFAVLGVRDNIDKPFKTYPLLAVIVSAYSYRRAAAYINSVYDTKAIRKCSTPGTYMEKRENKYEFGHKDFFYDSPDFQIDSFGHYWCEYYYQPITKPIRVYFYSNRDDVSFPKDKRYDNDGK